MATVGAINRPTNCRRQRTAKNGFEVAKDCQYGNSKGLKTSCFAGNGKRSSFLSGIVSPQGFGTGEALEQPCVRIGERCPLHERSSDPTVTRRPS